MCNCCNKNSSLRRFEKNINVPELIANGGSIACQRIPFSLPWLYFRIINWFLCLLITIYCYITCLLDTNYYSFFLYYNNWVLIISLSYLTLSLILTIKIYQNTQPFHLPHCLQPINQYARSNMLDLPSISSLKLTFLAKYSNITYHLAVTNCFVLCIAFWGIEFIHNIHSYLHLYNMIMKLDIAANYGILFIIISVDFFLNANKLSYNKIWFVLILSIIFHIWSFVFNYNAFLYQNDNDNNKDIKQLPSLFIYYNWDQTNENKTIQTHSITYIIFCAIILYAYIIIIHFILAYIKNILLYKWSRTNDIFIENAFDTEFELNDFSDDATALDEDMYNDKFFNNNIVGNGIVVHDKLKNTDSNTKDTQQEK